MTKIVTCPKCDSFEVEENKDGSYECVRCGKKFKFEVLKDPRDISRASYPEPYLTLARQK